MPLPTSPVRADLDLDLDDLADALDADPQLRLDRALDAIHRAGAEIRRSIRSIGHGDPELRRSLLRASSILFAVDPMAPSVYDDLPDDSHVMLLPADRTAAI